MSATLRGYWQLLRARPHFRRLWFSHIISLLGDWLSYVAVSVVAVERSESAMTVALVLVAHTLPLALVSPIAGPVSDRYDRRNVLVIAHVGAGVLTLGMWGATEAGWILGLQALLLVRVCISGVGVTARISALPALVEPEELHSANTFFGLTWSVLFAAGVVVGGVLTTVLGPELAIMLDACTFAVAAAIASALPPIPPGRAPVAAPTGPARAGGPLEAQDSQTSTATEEAALGADARPRVGLRDLLDAWRYARARPRTQSTLMAKGASAAANGAAWVALTLLAEDMDFGLGVAASIGVMHAARGIGTGLGPLIPTRLLRAEANYGTPMAFLGIVGFMLSRDPWFVFPALVVWGMGSGHNWVAATTELQTTVPNHILGRTTAIDFSMFSLASCATAILAAAIVDSTGEIAWGVWAGLGVAIPFWAYLFRLRRAVDGSSPATPP